MRFYLCLFVAPLLFLLGCTVPKTDVDNPAQRARKLLQEAVKQNGLEDLNQTAIRFRFRDYEYRYEKSEGQYVYERWRRDTTSGKMIYDVLTNEGFHRFADGAEVPLEPKRRDAYANSVNSVVYFAFLPYALLDPAVQPRYLGRDTIKGEVLNLIGVTFRAEGGGKDFQDDYRYWFTPETHELKYLAYAHPDGKIPRFRAAYNERTVDGIRVRDYRNYHTPQNTARNIDELAQDYEMGALPLLSVIDLEDVRKVKLRPGFVINGKIPMD